jgi:hypothetical protein
MFLQKKPEDIILLAEELVSLLPLYRCKDDKNSMTLPKNSSCKRDVKESVKCTANLQGFLIIWL